MNSQLATVLTNGSLDDKNGRQCVAGLGAVPEVSADPKENTLSSCRPGAPQSSAKEVNSSNDGQSFNGETADMGEMSKPPSQEMGELPGLKQPIKIKTGVPVLRKQPIRIKIVVPPRCKRPMTNSAISLTKDTYHSEFTGLTPASNCNPSSGITTENNTETLPVALLASTMMTEQETKEAVGDGCEKPKVESFQRTETAAEKEEMHKEDVTGDGKVNENTTYPIIPEMSLISSTNKAPLQGPEGISEVNSGLERENNIPLNLHTVEWKSNGCGEVDQVVMEEQTEALDLSLPKKRESRDRRYGRFLDDPGYESSLIMEVDEFEGDGDRDIVEEDDGDYEEDRLFSADSGVDTFGAPLLSPSFFSTSVLTSLSSVDCDTENLLLIDDQGIPYTLSPDGHKVPQIDSSSKPVDPLSNRRMDKPDLRNVQGGKSSHLASLAGRHVSQSLENMPQMQSARSGDINPSPASTAGLPSLGEEFSMAGQDMESEEPSKATEPAGKAVHQAGDVNTKAPGTSPSSQPIQILTNTSANTTANTPILLLASSSSSSASSSSFSTAQLSSAPVGLSLPLSVTQSSPGASTPMLLLLSSVPSSSGQPVAASTPIAILDPSTGQLSQITGSAASVSLPLSSGQATALGSSLSSTLSHPIIRLSPNNPPVILSGVGGNLNPAPILTSLAVAPTTSALQTNALIASGGAVLSTTHLLHTRQNASNPSPDREAIATHKAPEENAKPSTFAVVSSSSPNSQSAGMTANPSDQPASDAVDQSPTSESKSDAPDPRSEVPPLEDHLYFSSTAAPPSPPMGPILTSGNFDTLDPMGPLSPASSPNSLGPRRVLYCHLCPRVFFYLSDLERHAITHSQKKPHVCQQCGKAFKRSSHLQRHKHIHTGQRNYVCPICAKRFREAGELQRHQRVHTGEKPYQCQLCHTRFAERNTLRRHTKRKHPYHQVAMEMLSERRGGGGEGGVVGRAGGVPEEEESAEWYSSTVSNLDNSESETEA